MYKKIEFRGKMTTEADVASELKTYIGLSTAERLADRPRWNVVDNYSTALEIGRIVSADTHVEPLWKSHRKFGKKTTGKAIFSYT